MSVWSPTEYTKDEIANAIYNLARSVHYLGSTISADGNLTLGDHIEKPLQSLADAVSDLRLTLEARE